MEKGAGSEDFAPFLYYSDTNIVPAAVSAYFGAFSCRKDILPYKPFKLGIGKSIPLGKSAEGKHAAVVSADFFIGIAAVFLIVGTFPADDVLGNSQRDVGVILFQHTDDVRHIFGEVPVIAVPSEKGYAHSVMWTKLTAWHIFLPFWR